MLKLILIFSISFSDIVSYNIYRLDKNWVGFSMGLKRIQQIVNGRCLGDLR